MKHIAFQKLFDKRIEEGISNQDKNRVKLLIESLKKEKPLSDLYYLINSIIVPDENLTEDLVPEYINQLKIVAKELTQNSLVNYNNLFESTAKENITYCDLDRDINTLFFEKNTTFNVIEKSKAYTNISNYLKECVKKNQNSTQLHEKITKYDSLFESLTDKNKDVLKEFWTTTNKEKAFNKVKEQTVDFLLEHMSNATNIPQIKEAIVKIVKIKYQPDTYVTNLVELLNLTNND